MTDIVMPASFPETDFRAFGIAATAFFPDAASDEALFDPQEKRRHFDWSWQAVRYRYLSCAECNDDFKALLNDKASEWWKAGGSDEELTYRLERCIYGFFTSALSVFDSFAFCLYFYGNALKPVTFPEVGNPRAITRNATAKAFTAAFPQAAITALLAGLSKDSRFSTIDTVRNLVGHRISGRRSVRSSGTLHSDGTHTTDFHEETWYLPGAAAKLMFDEELLQRLLDDVTALLTSLSVAAREFAVAQKAARKPEVSMSTESIQEFMARVGRDFERVFQEEHAPKEPDYLYHYTSMEGLVGIVSSRRFFLSDMLASTDQSEIAYGFRVVREVLEENKSHPLAERFLPGAGSHADFFDELGYIGKGLYEHATCFCETNDVLTQWRGYSPHGGVAIGVKFAELKRHVGGGELASSSPIAPPYSLVKILYSSDKQRTLARRIFACGREHFDELQGLLSDVPKEDHDYLIEFSGVLAQWFLRLALNFKHEAFASEEEWRLLTIEISIPPYSRTRELKFRTRGRVIIPYVELEAPEVDSLLVSEIRCSPGFWSRSEQHAIERLALSLGGGVKVTYSPIPL